MYKIDIVYYDMDDCLYYTDIYVSDSKKELLKVYLKFKKQYDCVRYRITELKEKPYYVYGTAVDMW